MSDSTYAARGPFWQWALQWALVYGGVWLAVSDAALWLRIVGMWAAVGALIWTREAAYNRGLRRAVRDLYLRRAVRYLYSRGEQ